MSLGRAQALVQGTRKCANANGAGAGLSRLILRRSMTVTFLQNRFNLTPAEARLVVHIVTGNSLKSSAKAFGVGYETVRRQVKSVFHKPGTHRQSELVLTVLRAVNECADDCFGTRGRRGSGSDGGGATAAEDRLTACTH